MYFKARKLKKITKWRARSGHIYNLSTWKAKTKRLAWTTESYLSYLRMSSFSSLSAVMLFWDHTGLEELCWMVLSFLFYLPCSVCLEPSPTSPPHTPGRRRDWWENKSTVGHLYFKQPWVPTALPSLLTLRRLVFFSTEWSLHSSSRSEWIMQSARHSSWH